MDKETELLLRLGANHLYLAQFEPLRATLLALRARNPDLALSFLQTIVANSGGFENIPWSPSCPSPSLLTYLSTLELLQFNNSTSSTWSFDPDTLRLRVEFLLIAQMLSDRVSESMRKNIDLDSVEKETEKVSLDDSESSFAGQAELLNKSDELREGNGELGDCMRVLGRILELGVRRLKADGVVNVDSGDGSGGGDDGGSERRADMGVVKIEEEELVCLKTAILGNADVFDALCRNIQKQFKGWEGDNSGLAITVRRDKKAWVDICEEVAMRVLGLIQRNVQSVHLYAMTVCLKEGDEDGAVSHIRFLHVDYGVEEAEYRYLRLNFLSYRSKMI